MIANTIPYHTSQVQHLREYIIAIQSQLKFYYNQRQALYQELSNFQKINNNMRLQIDYLVGQIKQFNFMMDQKNHQFEFFQSQIYNYQTTIKLLQSQLLTKNSQIQIPTLIQLNPTQQFNKKKKKIERQTISIKLNTQNQHQYEFEQQNKEQQVLILEMQMKEKNRITADLETQLKRHSDVITDKQSSIEKLQLCTQSQIGQTFSITKQSLPQLQKSFLQITHDLEIKNQESHKKSLYHEFVQTQHIEQIQQLKIQLQNTIERLCQTDYLNQQLQNQLFYQDHRIKILDQQIKQKDDQLKTLQIKKAEQLQAQILQKDIQIMAIKSQLLDLKSVIILKESLLSRQGSQLSEALGKLEHYWFQISQKQQQIQQIKNDFQVSCQQTRQRQQEINLKNIEISDLQIENTKLSSSYNTVQNQLQKTIQDNHQINLHYQNKIHFLKQQIAQQQNTILHYHNQLLSQNNRLNNLKNQQIIQQAKIQSLQKHSQIFNHQQNKQATHSETKSYEHSPSATSRNENQTISSRNQRLLNKQILQNFPFRLKDQFKQIHKQPYFMIPSTLLLRIKEKKRQLSSVQEMRQKKQTQFNSKSGPQTQRNLYERNQQDLQKNLNQFSLFKTQKNANNQFQSPRIPSQYFTIQNCLNQPNQNNQTNVFSNNHNFNTDRFNKNSEIKNQDMGNDCFQKSKSEKFLNHIDNPSNSKYQTAQASINGSRHQKVSSQQKKISDKSRGIEKNITLSTQKMPNKGKIVNVKTVTKPSQFKHKTYVSCSISSENKPQTREKLN